MRDLYDESGFFTTRHGIWLIGLGLVYAALAVAQWSAGYIDFGDGNYMYISRRIAEGAVVYRDILAPQPPCHLFLGALIVKLAGFCSLVAAWVGGEAFEPLYFFRAFSLLLHLGVYALVVKLAWHAWGQATTATVAGAIYLWLPIGYWWSLGYQSEPLEIFFLLLMLLMALRGTAWGDVLAGIFAALAALTNATAAPFLLVLIIYMIARAPLRAVRMALPCILLASAVTFLLQVWTQGAFVRNAVLNQVGTFPTESAAAFFGYAKKKLLDQGGNVLMQEGAFLVLALIGIWRFLGRSPLDSVARGGLGWFCLTSLGAIVYVAKGGTEDYIYTLAEPAVAILAAGELRAWSARWRAATMSETGSGWSPGAVSFPFAKIVATALLAAFALGPGVNLYWQIWNQRGPFEAPADKALVVKYLLQKYSSPDRPVLAPPYYAFLANRRLWGDFSELFIWQMKYFNERREQAEREKGLAPAEAGQEPRREALETFARLAAAIRDRQVAIVILEMDQTGKTPEVMAALQRSYIPWKPAPLETRNTRLGIFIPFTPKTPEQQTEQRQKWQDFRAELERLYGPTGARQTFGLWFDQPSPTTLSK